MSFSLFVSSSPISITLFQDVKSFVPPEMEGYATEDWLRNR